MRRGAKPKPTVLHHLHGSLNATRHRDRAFEPVAPGALEDMEPPADLNDEELATWRYALQHAPKGVLKHIDRTVLILWVKTAERYRRAEVAQAQINAQAPMPDVIRSPSGMLVQSPYIGMMNRAALLMLRIAEQLGFTPVSRPRLAERPSRGGGLEDDDRSRWLRVMDLARKPSNHP
jgi:P27 family predicted phage terminase small subunit